MENPSKKKPNILIRLILFLLALVLVLGTVCLVLFRDYLNMDALRRWYHYRSLTLSDTGQAESFDYSGTVNDLFADVDGDLLVCTGNIIGLYSGSGTQYISQQVALSAPAVDVNGDTAVVYDAGGTELYVFRQRALVYSMQCDGALLSAHLNSSGWLTTVSQESGYRGVVTVYDAEGATKAALRLSSAYIMEAVLADDGTTLSVVTVGQSSGAFSSSFSVYDLSSLPPGEVIYEVTPAATTALGNRVILALRQSEDSVFVLGDYGICILDSSAAQLGSQDWSELYLKNYSLGGDGFAVALLGKYRAGSQSVLYVVDNSGTLLGSLSLDEQVLALSAAGQYFAVLTADRLDLYTRDLKLFRSLSGTQGARKVLLRSDGTAMLLSNGSARLYVPS